MGENVNEYPQLLAYVESAPLFFFFLSNHVTNISVMILLYLCR